MQDVSEKPVTVKGALGAGIVEVIFDMIPPKHRLKAANIAVLSVLGLWVLDLLIPDPLPLVDEVGLPYIIYLIWQFRKGLISPDQKG